MFCIRFPSKEERRVEALQHMLDEEKQRNDDLETAAVELADIVAAQDDAIVELAELIGE